METKTQTELEKQIEEAASEYSKMAWRHEPYCELSVEDMFKAGAKFILEMPELEEFFTISTLLVSTYLSHFDYCDSLYEDEGACNCGLDTEEQCFNNALSKLRELGLV